MGTKHIRHLVTELAARLSDRDFLRKAGISRRTMQEIFVRDKWEEALESLFPIRERLSCKQILELCHPELWALSGEPEEGWISFTYKFSTHILYPDPEFSEKAASYARGAYVYLNVLQFFFDEERKAVPFDPFNDFALLGEEEYQSCDRAGEYGRFVREFRDQYIYEMMRLNREATPFETLSHIAGVHHVAMTVARGLKKAGVPIDLALSSGAAAGHDLGKFGCKPNERVPYLHYYYTNQWFMAYKMEGIGHIAALLSLQAGLYLLPTESQEAELLHRVVEAGGVDGCTKEHTETVDHLSLAVHLSVLRSVSQALTAQMEENGQASVFFSSISARPVQA